MSSSDTLRTFPAIPGERVTLRSGRLDDGAELRAVFDEPEVARWWPTPSDDELRDLLENRDPDVDVWMIEVEGNVVGLIQAYENTDPMYRHAGIDIVLHPRVHGQGLGPEAIRVLARHLFGDRGHHRIVIDPNAANANVMREYEWSAHEGRWTDGVLMDLRREDLTES
jgi:aminoglycoside 6'-N-acetyltransferase